MLMYGCCPRLSDTYHGVANPDERHVYYFQDGGAGGIIAFRAWICRVAIEESRKKLRGGRNDFRTELVLTLGEDVDEQVAGTMAARPLPK